jgi:cobalamin biosynthesis Mg chelatase CobN
VRNTDAGPTVLHFEQGAYDVVTDARGTRTVHPVAASGVEMDTQRGKAVELERPRTLDAFESEIRETIRRREAIRMEMIEQQQKRETSIWTQIERNKLLVALALLGLVLATWHFVRRG